MRLFGDAKVLRGSIAWTNFLRPGVSVLRSGQTPALDLPALPAPAAEFDEDGRQWVFRFPRTVTPRYTIRRDRIFDYMRRHRLPSEGTRQIRRDVKNCADFYTDVRDLQTHTDPESLE